MVQWLGLHAPKAGGLGLIPGQGTRSHKWQLQRSHRPQGRAKTSSATPRTWHSQIKKFKKKTLWGVGWGPCLAYPISNSLLGLDPRVGLVFDKAPTSTPQAIPRFPDHQIPVCPMQPPAQATSPPPSTFAPPAPAKSGALDCLPQQAPWGGVSKTLEGWVLGSQEEGEDGGSACAQGVAHHNQTVVFGSAALGAERSPEMPDLLLPG